MHPREVIAGFRTAYLEYGYSRSSNVGFPFGEPERSIDERSAKARSKMAVDFRLKRRVQVESRHLHETLERPRTHLADFPSRMTTLCLLSDVHVAALYWK